jgi:hypothetical protein
MTLLLTVVAGARAQSTASDLIDLSPNADGTVWTLPNGKLDYDMELEVTYYTDEEVAEMIDAAFAAGVDLTTTDGKIWMLDETPNFDIDLDVEYETALALNEEADNTAKLNEWDSYEADVTLTRTLTKDMWNTFAVPFSTAIPSGWNVKELTSASFADGTLTLNFATAASIEAGKPYLVKVGATTDLSASAFTDVLVSKTGVPFTSTNVDFVPTLGATTIPAGETKEVLFLASDNQLKNPSSLPTTIKGFRAYFVLRGETIEARAFNMNIDDETTGITTTDYTDKTDAMFDLQGRKVATPTKGVYILDRKKVIIK